MIPERRRRERRKTLPSTDLEKTNLEAHVDLCAMRYKHLEERLDRICDKVEDIHQELVDRDDAFYKNKKIVKAAWITGGATVLAASITTLVIVITTYWPV